MALDLVFYVVAMRPCMQAFWRPLARTGTDSVARAPGYPRVGSRSLLNGHCVWGVVWGVRVPACSHAPGIGMLPSWLSHPTWKPASRRWRHG